MTTNKYPPLPSPAMCGPAGTGQYFDGFTADPMQAYVDADRELRAAEQAETAAVTSISAPVHAAEGVHASTAVEIIRHLVDHIERNTCEHHETYRAGSIWEICSECGSKWEDDKGGKPEFQWHNSVDRAREFILSATPSEKSNSLESGGIKAADHAIAAEGVPSFWPVNEKASRKQLIDQIGQMNFRISALQRENDGLIKRVKNQRDALASTPAATPVVLPEPDLYAINAAPPGYSAHWEQVAVEHSDAPNVVEFVSMPQVRALLAGSGQAQEHAGQGVGETVAYLDIGAGGYLDIGSDLSDEQLSKLPKGRHMLAISGTHGVDGYAAAPAQSQADARDAELWCVHVSGSDDVHAMPSRAAALEHANGLNIAICRIERQDIDPVMHATATVWPHSAESHTAAIAAAKGE